MCGIAGVVGSGDARGRTQAMVERLVHRGPDGQGVWSNRDVALGHTRLSIVDLSEAGAQPMVSKDGHTVVTVNGEIYNYGELRRDLENQGMAFVSDCDSEVVLHLYRQGGLDALAKLQGMFAFGLWDSKERTLIVVRDRVGIKPVYYTLENGVFAFASEIKALLSGRTRARIDPKGLGQYLTYQNLFGAQTMVEGVHLVEPGCAVLVREGKLQNVSLWEAPWRREPTIHAFDEATGAFERIFKASVRRHLMSDVPVATYLSAGFDSASVTAIAQDAQEQPLHCFTGAFSDGGWYDEFSGAAAVAGHVGATIHRVEVSSAGFGAMLDDLVFALDEPRMGMGAFPQFLVAQNVARTHKVVLTGHGGDELFSGYPVFKLLEAKRRPGSLLGVRASEWPHLAYFAGNLVRGGERGCFLPVLFSAREQRRGLLPHLRRAVGAYHPQHALGELLAGSEDAYEMLMRTYMQAYLPGLLVVEDKISMAHSLESRTPMLDHALIELAFSISPRVKLHGSTLKAIIKDAMRPHLPPSLYQLPKRGFPTPLASWLRGPLAPLVRERLASPHGALTRLFEPGYLKTVVSRFLARKAPLRALDEIPAHRMWMLLSLESYLRQYEERLGVTLEAA